MREAEPAAAAAPLPDTPADDPSLLPWLAPQGMETAWVVPDDGATFDRGKLAASRDRAKRLWTVAALALFLGITGAGYFWRAPPAATVARPAAQAGVPATPKPPAPVPSEAAGPKVAGRYTAYLMDQEIELVFQDSKSVLAAAKGTVRYFNTVTGGRCVARLIPLASTGIGENAGEKVLFSQQAVDGEPACPQPIPMLIDLNEQFTAPDGLASRISVQWQSPETRQVVMAGDLVLNVGAE